MGITSKWPRLLVVGDPITEDQADEVVVRTTDWRYMCGGDAVWSAEVAAAAVSVGMPEEYRAVDDRVREPFRRYRAFRAWARRLGILQLRHLDNERIMSAWFGGLHGWCDWDGRIGCSSHNVGKWPTTSDITSDWLDVARAFPFLRLTAQVVEDGGTGGIAGEWRIADGRVGYDAAPDRLVCAPTEPVAPDAWPVRGCSTDRLRQALARTVTAADERRQRLADDGEPWHVWWLHDRWTYAGRTTNEADARDWAQRLSSNYGTTARVEHYINRRPEVMATFFDGREVDPDDIVKEDGYATSSRA
jgi:hypothetical protein